MSDYKPVTNFLSALPKLENILGFKVPDEILNFWKNYNLGTIGDMRFYGLSATVNAHHNLMVGLANGPVAPKLPTQIIPLFDQGPLLYFYDVVKRKVYQYSRETETYEEVEATLENVVDLASKDMLSVSLECDTVVYPEEQTNWLVTFLRTEVPVEKRTQVLCLALAFSLEVDPHSGNSAAYFNDYHAPRVVAILAAAHKRVLLDHASALDTVANTYAYRCEVTQFIPVKRLTILDELDERLIEKARVLTKNLKKIAV